MALKIDSSEKYALFVNETKYGSEINNLKDLQKYIDNKYDKKKTVEQPKFYTKTDKATYVNVGNICPACKYEGVSNLKECPSCELNFN
ncbi:hypothetical protein [Mesonia sp.]|uniref:hypothetical protein n=1 Tax=Mesonia sp. TaxID=1960830 RepID=UPI003F97B105